MMSRWWRRNCVPQGDFSKLTFTHDATVSFTWRTRLRSLSLRRTTDLDDFVFPDFVFDVVVVVVVVVVVDGCGHKLSWHRSTKSTGDVVASSSSSSSSIPAAFDQSSGNSSSDMTLHMSSVLDESRGRMTSPSAGSNALTLRVRTVESRAAL